MLFALADALERGQEGKVREHTASGDALIIRTQQRPLLRKQSSVLILPLDSDTPRGSHDPSRHGFDVI
jgi:hypothetical protein